MAAQQGIEAQIISAIRRVVRAIDVQSRKLAARCGFTGPQLVTLRAIERYGPISLKVLARQVSIGQATITGIVDRLEGRGYVVRERDTRDRRKITVRLTSEGRRLLKQAPPLLQDNFRNQLGKLEDWERAQMLATLQRVASLMDAEELEAAPLLETGPVSETPPSDEEVEEEGGAGAFGEIPGGPEDSDEPEEAGGDAFGAEDATSQLGSAADTGGASTSPRRSAEQSG